jgi:hypothetical protein
VTASPWRMSHPPLPEGNWYACQFPERAGDVSKKLWRVGCRACWVDFEAMVRREPDPRRQNLYRATTGKRVGVYDIEAAREWWFSPRERTA